MRNKLAFLALLLSVSAWAAPGEKRTILTSGDKVHTIRYQLGQSTVLYFGMKPETVICGNKNYFHIDKFKEGITIQGISSLPTNLTVLTQGKRFLFYLMPANGGRSDAFVEVRWVPEEEVKPIFNERAKQVVREIRGSLKLGSLQLQLSRLITIDGAKRSILEFTVKNMRKASRKTSDIEILLQKGKVAVAHQIVVFAENDLKFGASTKGRIIVTGEALNGASLTLKFDGLTGKIQGATN